MADRLGIPTRRQKTFISKHGFYPGDYYVLKEDESVLVIINRITNEQYSLLKGGH